MVRAQGVAFDKLRLSGFGVISANLTVERPTFVSHLECALTGERYPADRLDLAYGKNPMGYTLFAKLSLGD